MNPAAARLLLYTVYFIYFFCGLTQCFEGVFLPEFKEYFRLNYEQQMYTMFAKNIPFLLAIVIGYRVHRAGYKNFLTIAMALYAVGTYLLVPGLQSGRYSLVLCGFFLIGLGFNFQLVAGNPMLTALGPESGASARLNLGNALGAVAQIIAPATLSFLIPAAAVTVAAKLPYMQSLFTVLAAILVLTAMVTFFLRTVDISAAFEPAGGSRVEGDSIWRHPRLLLGFVTIFLILGFEAGLFGFYRNFLEDPAIAGLTSRASQQMFTLYFAVFALGRLTAAWLQKRMSPAKHLAGSALAAIACLFFVVTLKGAAAVAAVTALGFFISIFFPTLYSLAIAGMGPLTGQSSGLLTMGFVGCALIPVLQGRLADATSLQSSYALGFVPYAITVLYALRAPAHRV